MSIKAQVKSYLYEYWADSCPMLAILVLIMSYAAHLTTPWTITLVWLQFAVYLIHQFEEHVFPGHFKEFINKAMFNSDNPAFPVNAAAVFWINILAIWILFPLAALLAQTVSPQFGVLLPVFGLFNASLHIIGFLVKKQYNPGLVVSVFLNYPTGLYTLYVFKQQAILTTGNFWLAFLVTVAAHAVILSFVLKNIKHLKKSCKPMH